MQTLLSNVTTCVISFFFLLSTRLEKKTLFFQNICDVKPHTNNYVIPTLGNRTENLLLTLPFVDSLSPLACSRLGLDWLVGWLFFFFFYGVSTLFRSFNAELSHFDKSFKRVSLV